MNVCFILVAFLVFVFKKGILILLVNVFKRNKIICKNVIINRNWNYIGRKKEYMYFLFLGCFVGMKIFCGKLYYYFYFLLLGFKKWMEKFFKVKIFILEILKIFIRGYVLNINCFRFNKVDNFILLLCRLGLVLVLFWVVANFYFFGRGIIINWL